jgi:hypothetical protein
MKNLFLLPTDKPSKLIKLSNGELRYNENSEVHSFLPQNIYITSDEEIKEGVNQWYLDKFLNKPRNSSGSQYGENQNVIILTTDQDLIKDGVQDIDDEFLEWFVKNPSCEEIEVDWVDFSQSYFIKIPKEELKQETIEEDLDEIKNIRLWLKDRKQRFIKQLKNKQ